MKVRGFLALCALVAAALPVAALAQAWQCSVPAHWPRPAIERPDGPVRRVPVTGYTLALSWSPEFCRSHRGSAAQRMQCGGGNGRFGFVVHGLWPEGAATFPQWCAKVAQPAPRVAAGQFCRTPSPALISHAWAKHGSCAFRRPEVYFRVSNILADAMRYPDMARLSRDRALNAGALRQALAQTNPGRPPQSFGLLLSRGGWLREVRVCLDQRYRPRRCPARNAGPRDSARVSIWRSF